MNSEHNPDGTAAKRSPNRDYNYLKRALLRGADTYRFEPRLYQLRAAHIAAKAVNDSRHAVLTLPTGTGKTLICGMAAALYLRDNPGSKVVLTAPRVTLLKQLSDRTEWLHPTFGTRGVGLNARETSVHVSATFQNYPMVFGMPDFLSRRFATGSVDGETVARIGLLIVDEFDAFLTIRYLATSTKVSFHTAFQNLIDRLPAHNRLLLVSATTPEPPVAPDKDSYEDQIDKSAQAAFRKFLNDTFDPVYIEPPTRDYKDFIPHAEIIATPVRDTSVVQFDQAISSEFRLLVNWISGYVKFPIDPTYLLPRLDKILSGKLKYFPRKVDSRLRGMLGRLKQISHVADFLYEDMFDACDWRCDEVSVWDSDLLRRYKVEALRLETPEADDRGKQSFYPDLRGKYKTLTDILRAHRGQKGVLFFRYVRLLREVSDDLKMHGLEVVEVHGENLQAENTRSLDRFRKEDQLILLITRDTGKRGLDLPEADFAVFYSPKSRDDVTWQEVSRIRSTVHNQKETYILFYENTGEEGKTLRTLSALKNTTHSNNIRVLQPWPSDRLGI